MRFDWRKRAWTSKVRHPMSVGWVSPVNMSNTVLFLSPAESRLVPRLTSRSTWGFGCNCLGVESISTT